MLREKYRALPSGWPSLLDLLALLALLAVTTACGMVDKMSGISVAKELQEKGVPASAEILRLWDTGITVNEDPVIGLAVEVRPTDRPAYEARIEKTLISRLDVPQFQPGKIIPVRFDPQAPQRVAVDLYKYR